MDVLSLSQQILDICRTKSLRITTAESCTGGLIAGTLTEIPGSSDMFERGYVTYSNGAKSDMLGVKAATLNEFGAVSQQVAMEMAKGALVSAGADLALAITGIAGPGGSDHKPEGRVCFALAVKNQTCSSETIEFLALGRQKVRKAAVLHGLKMIVTRLSR